MIHLGLDLGCLSLDCTSYPGNCQLALLAHECGQYIGDGPERKARTEEEPYRLYRFDSGVWIIAITVLRTTRLDDPQFFVMPQGTATGSSAGRKFTDQHAISVT